MNTNASAAAPVSATTPPVSGTAASTGPFAWLADRGARFDAQDIPDFGDAGAEAAAALGGDVIAPLADRAVLRARGADADGFLQGQLSNDLRELTASRAQLSSYSNPKGRVLAVFTLLRDRDSVLLETQASVAAATLKRLRMFVLRSKLTLDDAGSDAVAAGLSGPNAAAILAQAGLPVPEIVWGCTATEALIVMRRPGTLPRYSIHGTGAALAALWPRLAAQARPVGTAAWRLLDLLAGLPAVHPETSEQHVAQMLNLDRLEGISFAKGCYPGQEIVARLHYLGGLKRRLFTGYADGPLVPRGAPVFAAEGGNAQPAGEVLDRASHPTRGQIVQAVLQVAQREQDLRLGSVEGPALRLEAGEG